jgi:glucose dehydrogenase
MRVHWWRIFQATVLLAAATFTLQGQAPTGEGVTSQRLLKADDEPGNWLMYSRTYNSWRYSTLNQINVQSV